MGRHFAAPDRYTVGVERRRTDRAQERERGRWRRRAGSPGGRQPEPATGDAGARRVAERADELLDTTTGAGKGPR